MWPKKPLTTNRKTHVFTITTRWGPLERTGTHIQLSEGALALFWHDELVVVLAPGGWERVTVAEIPIS